MSTNRETFETTYEINVGSSKEFEATILDPDTGSPKSLEDAVAYNNGIVQILKPDGTQIGTDIVLTFSVREDGIVTFTVLDTITTPQNAGNWKGKIIFKNSSNIIVDQQSFGFNILE